MDKEFVVDAILVEWCKGNTAKKLGEKIENSLNSKWADGYTLWSIRDDIRLGHTTRDCVHEHKNLSIDAFTQTDDESLIVLIYKKRSAKSESNPEFEKLVDETLEEMKAGRK